MRRKAGFFARPFFVQPTACALRPIVTMTFAQPRQQDCGRDESKGGSVVSEPPA
jgi:hypothetical protein